MLTLPKKTIVTAATVAPALVLGVIIAAPGTHSAPQTTQFANASATQVTDSGTQSTPPSSQLTIMPGATTSDQSAQTTTPSPDTSTATTQPTDTTTLSELSDPAPALVTAISAVLSDFSAPQPVQGAPDGTMRQDRYCLYTYSDGSTQQQLYETKYTKGGLVWGADPTFDCIVANAPAAQ